MVICLERGVNDLHMVQPMPLPPNHLLLHQNPEWFCFSNATLPRFSGKNRLFNGCSGVYFLGLNKIVAALFG